MTNEEFTQRAFRYLRAAWFDEVLRETTQDRNAELESIFSKHTERILAGESLPVAPSCADEIRRFER